MQSRYAFHVKHQQLYSLIYLLASKITIYLSKKKIYVRNSGAYQTSTFIV